MLSLSHRCDVLSIHHDLTAILQDPLLVLFSSLQSLVLFVCRISDLSFERFVLLAVFYAHASSGAHTAAPKTSEDTADDTYENHGASNGLNDLFFFLVR